jgi:hypothetical protein
MDRSSLSSESLSHQSLNSQSLNSQSRISESPNSPSLADDTGLFSKTPIDELADFWDVELDIESAERFSRLQDIFEQFWHAKSSAEREERYEAFKSQVNEAQDARFDALRGLIEIARIFLSFPVKLRGKLNRALQASTEFLDFEGCLQDRLVVNFMDAMMQRGISIEYALPCSDHARQHRRQKGLDYGWSLDGSDLSGLVSEEFVAKNLSPDLTPEELNMFPESIRSYMQANPETTRELRDLALMHLNMQLGASDESPLRSDLETAAGSLNHRDSGDMNSELVNDEREDEDAANEGVLGNGPVFQDGKWYLRSK